MFTTSFIPSILLKERDQYYLLESAFRIRIRIHPDPLHLAGSGSGSTLILASDPDPDPDPLDFFSRIRIQIRLNAVDPGGSGLNQNYVEKKVKQRPHRQTCLVVFIIFLIFLFGIELIYITYLLSGTNFNNVVGCLFQ